MPSFDEARRLILASVAPVFVERVPLLDAAGRVLAEEIVAPWKMPFFDNSAMDGFAVRAADCAGHAAADASNAGARLKIIGYLPAGARAGRALEPGCAIKIMTGAPVPPGCDAVVPVEETEEADGHVRIRAAVRLRQHIRFTGEDMAAGERILAPGSVLHPPAISVLAACGRAQVAVYGRVRVAILSTGDELIELGEAMAEGRVVNSNAYALAAAVRETGGVPVLLGIARDDPGQLREKLVEGLKADALITSAGVSVGDRDFVRDVLGEMEVQQLFHQVKVKPGGPTAFGLKEGKPVFALPGNPVSTMVIFEEMVRPALLKMMGHRRVLKAPVTAILQEPLQKKPGKVHLQRVRLECSGGGWRAYSAGDQNSGILKTMLRADGLAILPAEAIAFAPGEELRVHLLSGEVEMIEESALWVDKAVDKVAD